MDQELRAAVDAAIVSINGYIDSPFEIKNDRDKHVFFHLIQAKQAMMKALIVDNSGNFLAHKLVREYERQLIQISKPTDKP